MGMYTLEKTETVYVFDTLDEALKYAERKEWKGFKITRIAVGNEVQFMLEKQGGKGA